ncbi:MAG: PQQ-dependent sugar dehydrogenase [Chthoniobacter sp.]|uniref:PQQ-dependent sugar dehydrogenase n=1 Tax=Chthoniobacter sp. TaxID=2510640 RepID=UPI0032A6EC2C
MRIFAMTPAAPVRLAGLLFAALLASADAAPPAEQMARGEKTFTEKCAMCHQPSGLGTPPVYPPLARSEWLTTNREGAVKALAEGLSGPVDVAGKHFDNLMPAQILDDQQVADVLTFAGNSWGNTSPIFTAEEVGAGRSKSKFPTYDKLLASAAYRALPAAPVGFALREVAKSPEFLTRLAVDPVHKTVYALAEKGSVYVLDLAVGAFVQIIKAGDYLELSEGDTVTMGMTVDAQGRLWVVSNQKRTQTVPHQNEVVIWRSSETVDGHPAKMQPWFRTHYPYGVGPYNHGVSHLAFGPDGMLYVNSGSRTDGGEPGNDPQRSQGGEVEITACIWRFDPRAEQPKIEVYARGIRNAYGFAWDDAGDLFTFANGPDYNAPEEMDFVQQGRHYGFPFQFANWPVTPGFPYAYTPPPPPGVEFTPPVINLGPAGGGSAKGLSTFDAHSSPGGAIWCGGDFPAVLRGCFLVPRFGNLLGPPAAPEDVGFDLLAVRVDKSAGSRLTAKVETLLAPLARPLDVLSIGRGRILILEYTRPIDFKSKTGWLPGRVLELAPIEPARETKGG